jgi:hypothetical protein
MISASRSRFVTSSGWLTSFALAATSIGPTWGYVWSLLQQQRHFTRTLKPVRTQVLTLMRFSKEPFYWR